jgi:hypothetical protein
MRSHFAGRHYVVTRISAGSQDGVNKIQLAGQVCNLTPVYMQSFAHPTAYRPAFLGFAPAALFIWGLSASGLAGIFIAPRNAASKRVFVSFLLNASPIFPTEISQD